MISKQRSKISEYSQHRSAETNERHEFLKSALKIPNIHPREHRTHTSCANAHLIPQGTLEQTNRYSQMRQINCIILPTGQTRVLQLNGASGTAEELLSALSDTLLSEAVHAEFYVASSTGLSVLEGALVGDGVFALVRLRAGGKGGFRKQLEKKGREFARAKAKEDRANKKPVTSKDTTRPRRQKTVVLERSSISKSSAQTTLTAETLAVRALAAQGVLAALKKFCSQK